MKSTSYKKKKWIPRSKFSKYTQKKEYKYTMNKRLSKWGNTFYSNDPNVANSRSYSHVIKTSKYKEGKVYKEIRRNLETKSYGGAFTLFTFTSLTEELITPSTSCWDLLLGAIT